MSYDLIVIGTSAGGIDALKSLLTYIKSLIDIPVIVVQHLEPNSPSYLAEILEGASNMPCHEAEDKIRLHGGHIYTPAPNYHIMMEKDWTLSLTVDERVAFARPSIDVLFESVADALKDRVIGILLTGANHDGAYGLSRIKAHGGYTIVQDPDEAYTKEMPLAALRIMEPDDVLPLKEIAKRIDELILVQKVE